MAKKSVVSRNFNLDSYWDTIDIDSGLAVGSVVGLIPISQYCLVQTVLAFVMKEAVGTGAATVVVGDADDADGFLLSQDLKVSKSQLYGNDPDDLGKYLKLIRPYDGSYSELTPFTPHEQLMGKFYTADTNIRVVTTIATAAATTAGKVRVWVKLLQLMTRED